MLRSTNATHIHDECQQPQQTLHYPDERANYLYQLFSRQLDNQRVGLTMRALTQTFKPTYNIDNSVVLRLFWAIWCQQAPCTGHASWTQRSHDGLWLSGRGLALAYTRYRQSLSSHNCLLTQTQRGRMRSRMVSLACGTAPAFELAVFYNQLPPLQPRTSPLPIEGEPAPQPTPLNALLLDLDPLLSLLGELHNYRATTNRWSRQELRSVFRELPTLLQRPTHTANRRRVTRRCVFLRENFAQESSWECTRELHIATTRSRLVMQQGCSSSSYRTSALLCRSAGLLTRPQTFVFRWVQLWTALAESAFYRASAQALRLGIKKPTAGMFVKPSQVSTRWFYEITISSRRRNTWFSLACIPNIQDSRDTYFCETRRVLVNFSAMSVGKAYSLPKKNKTSTLVKLLAARFLRRHLIVLNLTTVSVRLSGGIENFKTIWSSVVTPLEEVFFHPLRQYLVGDLALTVDRRGSGRTLVRQLDVFFEAQYEKIVNHIEAPAGSLEFTAVWEHFRQRFLRNCREVSAANSSGKTRLFWNYAISSTQITLPANFIRRKTYRKPVRSIRRRISKRITREMQRRLWVF